MAVKDDKMAADGFATWKTVTCEIGSTATSQTGLEVDSFTPGFPFEIEAVEAYCTAITATASVDCLIGSTSALASAITPVAGTATAGTLSTTRANRRGSATDVVNIQYTTDGSGALTKGKVRVTIRPFPLNGEAMPTAGL